MLSAGLVPTALVLPYPHPVLWGVQRVKLSDKQLHNVLCLLDLLQRAELKERWALPESPRLAVIRRL